MTVCVSGGVLQLTNEPPSGLKANLIRAFCSFSPEFINEVEPKTRAILFGLCHFHAVLIERKKFGPIGYNIMYPFSLGDLRDSSVCLSNYMENASSKIPWEDLRYIFGQIMYGGHIGTVVFALRVRACFVVVVWFVVIPFGLLVNVPRCSERL
jgi:Na+-translocating ferredoxin:NAD+ oxidoreductase RnfD subunit